MRFEDLNWMDVEESVKNENRLLLVLGACEQHGYLSLLTDVKVPLALAEAASHQTGVLVAPPLNFGISPYFMTYPGTISLRLSTFVDAAEDIVRSAYGYGFRRFVIVNGHGGNEPARTRLTELANQLPGFRFAWYSWWLANSVEAVATAHDLRRYHASWMEAFPFTKVGDLPEGEKQPPEYSGVLNAKETREVFGDGVFGGPYQVDPEIMDEIFAACLQDVLHLLETI